MDILEKAKFAGARILDKITCRTSLGQEFIKRQIGHVTKFEDIDPYDNLTFDHLKKRIRNLSIQELTNICSHELNNKRRLFIISLVDKELNYRLYDA